MCHSAFQNLKFESVSKLLKKYFMKCDTSQREDKSVWKVEFDTNTQIYKTTCMTRLPDSYGKKVLTPAIGNVCVISQITRMKLRGLY
jgi:hypothetical protein